MRKAKFSTLYGAAEFAFGAPGIIVRKFFRTSSGSWFVYWSDRNEAASAR